MGKKFVRGVTDVDDIEKFDKTLTNVNDLLSDGKATYVHTKQGKNDKYVNITDKITSITSGDKGLIDVSINGDNNATLTPKHDALKEQVIESTNNTITVNRGGNGTSQTTKINTNPQKVLEHDNLLTNYGISKTKSENNTTLGLEYTRINVNVPYDLNDLLNGCVRSANFLNAPKPNTWFFVSSFSEGGWYVIQEAITLVDDKNTTYRRTKQNNVWGPWREQVGDKSVIDNLLAQKQNTITNNTSIGVSGTELRQLYTLKQSYSHANGLLKTHVKSVSQNTSITTPEEEYNFIVKINKGAGDATFVLNDHDKIKFSNIMTSYGQNNSVRISGCTFKLSGSSLTVSTGNNVDQNYVITFSDII